MNFQRHFKVDSIKLFISNLDHNSALENARMLKLSSYVLLASIDTIYTFSYAWVI